jgi:hypothetical protein
MPATIPNIYKPLPVNPKEEVELLELSKKIARKTRMLIRRSENRAPYGINVDTGTPWDLGADSFDWRGRAQESGWNKKSQEYLAWQYMAMASRSSQNQLRKVVDKCNSDLKMYSRATEAQKNDLFFQKLDAELTRLGTNRYAAWANLAEHTRFYDPTKPQSKRKHKDNSVFTLMEQVEADAKNAVRYRLGNCDQTASLAFVMFCEYQCTSTSLRHVNVEKFAASGLGHCFVVVNRPDGVDINDVTQWMNTPNVIICDPWWFHNGAAFRANDTSQDFKDLRDKIMADGSSNRLLRYNEAKLGSGHSYRYRHGTHKHHGLSYYYDSPPMIERKLRGWFSLEYAESIARYAKFLVHG